MSRIPPEIQNQTVWDKDRFADKSEAESPEPLPKYFEDYDLAKAMYEAYHDPSVWDQWMYVAYVARRKIAEQAGITSDEIESLKIHARIVERDDKTLPAFKLRQQLVRLAKALHII